MTATVTAGASLATSVAMVAARFPHAVAVDDGRRQLTYREMLAAADGFAARLRDRAGIRPGDRVALCLPPTADLVVALLGVLRAGACYVPLDQRNPPARSDLVLADARPRALIAAAGVVGAVAPGCVRIDPAEVATPTPGEPDAAPSDPELPAYVIYTSGTTGRPKGVPVTSTNVAALFEATRGLFAFGPDDTWVLFHSVAFDFSVWEIWGALLHGGRLLVPDDRTRLSSAAFAGLLADRGVTVLNLTPTAFCVLSRAVLADDVDTDRLRLRYVIFGGERLAPEVVRPWVRRFGLARPELVNMYGLTEATVHATHHRIGTTDLDGDASVIGRPLPGFTVRVLDDDGRDASRGQLVLAGPQVAGGYLNAPELTARRFVPGPGGVPYYHSGDLVETLPGGKLAYLGRADRQVKVRGHRIELGEVEAALRALSGVADSVVLPLPAPSGEPELVCAYTTFDDREIDPRLLRRGLRERVPQHMWPARYRWLPALPMTSNGKVDHERLRREWST